MTALTTLINELRQAREKASAHIRIAREEGMSGFGLASIARDEKFFALAANKLETCLKIMEILLLKQHGNNIDPAFNIEWLEKAKAECERLAAGKDGK